MPPPSAPTTAPAFILPTNTTSVGATARRSLVVVLKYKGSETPSTTPHESTTSESSGLIPPARQSLVVILRYRPPVPYTPPPPPSPATVAAYYPYPAPRTSTWSTDTAFGPPLQPSERDLPQFRSRATRNQDAATRSRQGQVIDLDPTDGLPVQKYALMKVTLNQDASADPTSTNTKSTNSAEWAAQFNTPQFPWSEPPVPSFQKELPTWNQELIRRARAGNTNAKLSVWDPKNNCWMSAAEAEKKATPLKSLHLNNLDVAADTNGKLANGDVDSQKSADDSDAADSSNESNKSADEDEEDADEGAPFKTSSTKRRKLANRLNGPDETRLIEVKKWVQLPSTIADRTPDRSFLAARRPGMPPLYNPEYAHKVFGQYSSSSTIGGTAGYDLGEGGGLSSATAAISGGADATAGANTPQRKNIPPRRKKKKLGGPGRKPKNWQAQQAAQVDGAADVKAPAPAPDAGQAVDGGAMEGVQASGEASVEAMVKTEAEGEDNNENESGSEAEGSEEGEIDETGGAEKTEAPKEVTVTPAPKQDPVSMSTSVGQARDAGTAGPAAAAVAEIHDISAPATTATETQASAAVPDFVITDTGMKDAESEHDQGLDTQAAPEAEPEPQPQPQGQGNTAPVTTPAPATTDTASAAEPPLPPPLATTAAANTEQATATTIPGLGALDPDSAHANANADAEEQQIIQENAEAITTTNTSTDITAAPEQTTVTSISEAIHDAAVIPLAAHEEIQRVKEDNAREAAGKVEDVDGGAEGGDEVDLLGAMDEAIDRGMSEGRQG